MFLPRLLSFLLRLLFTCELTAGSWFCIAESLLWPLYGSYFTKGWWVSRVGSEAPGNIVDTYTISCYIRMIYNKRMLWYFEEGGVVILRVWCGTLKGRFGALKMVVWYFEEGCVVSWGWMWYFEDGGVVLWRGWFGTLKRVLWYFEGGDLVLWRPVHNVLCKTYLSICHMHVQPRHYIYIYKHGLGLSMLWRFFSLCFLVFCQDGNPSEGKWMSSCTMFWPFYSY